MPLTNEQIETLFAFTKKKSVHYYDLQVELVDHLASSIEEEIEKNSNITFDAALQKVYSRFGIFGFAHVVQERGRSLIKQGQKMLWSSFKPYFSIPKIALTTLLFVSAYLLTSVLIPTVQYVVIMLIFLYCRINKIQLVRQRKKTDIKPLLLTQTSTFFILFPIWYALIFISVLIGKTTPVYPIAFAVVFTLIVILRLTATHIDKQVCQKAKALYPEAFSIAI